MELVNFNVVDRLETDVLICCDYCDRQIEEIKPRQRIVQRDGGTTLQIIGDSGERNRNFCAPDGGTTVPKGIITHANESTYLRANFLTTGYTNIRHVQTKRSGSIVVKPNKEFFRNNLYLVDTGVA